MKKELKKLTEEAKRQGFRARGIKSGTQFLPPDKTKAAVTVHRTPSDHRAFQNLVSQFRRAGLIWPPPGRKGKG